MKSEHRHELQTHELQKLTVRARPFLEVYGKILLGLAAALVVAVLVGIWWVSSSRAQGSVAWTQLLEARSAEDFASVADKHPGTPAASWAKLRAAEMHLESGVQLLFTNREAGLADLKAARESFEALVGQASLPQEIRERALFGLGRTLESLSTGDTGEAVAVYQRLVNEFPNSMFAGVTKRRIETLETGGAKEFYDWFAQQNPKPPEPAKPRDGLSNALPPLPSALTPLSPPQPAATIPNQPAEAPPAPQESAVPVEKPESTPQPAAESTPALDKPVPNEKTPSEKTPPPAKSE
jgi:hypothetical protein